VVVDLLAQLLNALYDGRVGNHGGTSWTLSGSIGARLVSV